MRVLIASAVSLLAMAAVTFFALSNPNWAPWRNYYGDPVSPLLALPLAVFVAMVLFLRQRTKPSLRRQTGRALFRSFRRRPRS